MSEIEIKEKHLDRREWYNDFDRSFACQYHKDELFEGGIGLITFTGLQKPELVETSNGTLCIGDKGYKWLELAPKNKNFVVTAMFHEDKFFQIYIDISLKNEIFENGDATFYDLFLDVVIAGDNKPIIIDSDELDEALSAKIITTSEYNMANETAIKIVDYYNSNKAYITKKLFEYLNLFV